MEKETLNEFIKKHSLAKQLRQHKADIVCEKFSNWLTSKPSSNSWHNSLYIFATEAPFSYTNPHAIDEILTILSLDTQGTLDVLKNQEEYISRAIFAFLRPSSSRQIKEGKKLLWIHQWHSGI
ncbi:MAG: hypothetical protein IPL71_17530 [Anaerolineales bacterium]|uniref:hypothetical protein n=1 Tax=Candidatus Villigracilis proximus TaxID=3140683 RepID=UPI003136B25E|nr:hypothetical protein [Anaerolineales bacterium]